MSVSLLVQLQSKRKMRTSRSRDASPQRHNGRDFILKELAERLDEFPSNTRMSTNETVHPDKNSSADPSLRHRGCLERVIEGERLRRFVLDVRRVGDDTGMLVLQERLSENERGVRTGICASTKA